MTRDIYRTLLVGLDVFSFDLLPPGQHRHLPHVAVGLDAFSFDRLPPGQHRHGLLVHHGEAVKHLKACVREREHFERFDRTLTGGMNAQYEMHGTLNLIWEFKGFVKTYVSICAKAFCAWICACICHLELEFLEEFEVHVHHGNSLGPLDLDSSAWNKPQRSAHFSSVQISSP